MQSSWAIGYALAALVAAVVMPVAGWRGVFFVGVLPAFFTLWIRRDVEEPEAWRSSRREEKDGGFAMLFRGRLLPLTVALTLMNACCLFAWWGFNLWVPAYLSLPATKGGVGLASHAMTAIVVFMQVGMWLGYVTFGYISDAMGRKRTYVAYLVSAAALLLVFSTLHTAVPLFFLAPLVAFAATGYFSGFAAVTAEVYETKIRSTAQGFTYNTGTAGERGGSVCGGLAGGQARLCGGVLGKCDGLRTRGRAVGFHSGDEAGGMIVVRASSRVLRTMKYS